MLNNVVYPEYSVDYISNVMSLRKPQKQSVKILDSILQDIKLSKTLDLQNAASDIHDVYPIFSDFEHTFMSLTFALATGVGKTRLMGAFITYLYTQKGVKNFFVVAPNLTIYNKLKNDLGDPSPDNNKYVFRGISCFATKQPNIWKDEDYRNRPASSLTDTGDVNIFIFNIAKFNSDDRNIMELNEYIGSSFYKYLQSLDDLVLIMDESHHYRATRSAEAINGLNPVIGLELTATPQVERNGTTVLFKNVVYEYSLHKAIKDGYTRTPYALTRRDVRAYNFSDDELDKTMINDGIVHHENMKAELYKYHINTGARLVKPFALIVCKNTDHAEKILSYVKSDEFMSGAYKDKVILIHSNQRGAEREENVNLLLEVEKATNPVEIVIHVNILKEGWDVDNLYTIIPLRTATSKTLREQTVGRGLRLPFGKRTGDKNIDSVTITAHDKFDEIIREAQSEDSIFNAEGVIYADYEQRTRVVMVQPSLFDTDNERQELLAQAGLDFNNETDRETYRQAVGIITNATASEIRRNPTRRVNADTVRGIVEEDIGRRYADNTDLQRLIECMMGSNQGIIDRIQDSEMFIPKLHTEQLGDETYIINDFDLDLSQFSYVPIINEVYKRNMLDSMDEDIVIINGVIDFNTIRPEKYLIDGIREISEIDYEKCPELIQKIVMQFLTHYRGRFGEQQTRNICVMHKKDIIRRFKDELLKHLAVKYDNIIETACGIQTIVRNYVVDYTDEVKNLSFDPEGTGKSIKSIVYEGASKSVTDLFKFDSNPERKFAIACDHSREVIRWLRPAPTQFNITYNRGKRYEPDFVVETADMYYLVEVKRRDEMNSVNVIAKKDRALQYCRIASEYNKANGHKEFRYLFIPDDEISTNSSFNNLKDRFITL